MNKTLLSAALIAGFGVAAFAPQAARATDGTITFHGQVNPTTCTINGGTPDFTVNLPPVATSTLASSGNTAGQTQFNIALTACTAGTTASAFFEQGANVSTTTGNLVPATGGASNVQLQLLNSDGTTAINLLTPTSNTTTADIHSGSGTLTYYVQYFATGASTPGAVSSTEQYTIAYQ